MELIERLAAWISENEALFSGLAALVALVALVPAALRPVLRRRAAAENTGKATRAANGAGQMPRIAVFPIEATGAKDDLVTAAEIVTEELTAFLARSSGCEVISRRSSSAFANAGGTTSEAGRELDVRYVVYGSIRAAGAGLRVGASLVDTTQDRVVWSDSFEMQSDDPSSVARSLAEKVAGHLGIAVTRAEVGRSRRQPRSRAARDLLLRSQGVLFDEGHSRESYARAIALLEQALAKDPGYAAAHGQLALLLALGHVFGFVDEGDESRERALRACKRAMELDDRSSDVLGYVGCAYCDLRQYAQGVPLLEQAIELNPSNAQAKAALGTAFVGQKRFEEAAALLEEAMRLTPAYKGIAPWSTVLAGAYLQLQRIEDAQAAIDRALRCDPTFFPAHLSAALVALLQQDREKAEHHMHEAKRIHPALDGASIIPLVGRRAAGMLAEWLGRA